MNNSEDNLKQVDIPRTERTTMKTVLTTTENQRSPYIPLTKTPRPHCKSQLYNSNLKNCLLNKKNSFTIHDNVKNRISLQSKSYEEHLELQEIMKNAEIGVTKNKYKDPDFKADLTNLSKIQQKYPYRLQWVRLSDRFKIPSNEFIKTEIENFRNFVIPMPPITIKNMYQDLTIPSILSCLTTQPALLNRIIDPYKTENLGIFKGFLFDDNNWKSYIIDDFIPVFKDEKTKKFKDINLDATRAGILPKLVEKIIAKHVGGYEKLPSTVPENILKMLTGGQIRTSDIPENMFDEIHRVQKIWDDLFNSIETGSIISLKSRKGIKEKNGLILNHNYSVVKTMVIYEDEAKQKKSTCV